MQRQTIRGIEERKRSAFGKIIDSTPIGGMGTIVGALWHDTVSRRYPGTRDQITIVPHGMTLADGANSCGTMLQLS